MKYENIDIASLSDEERRSMAVKAHKGATHFCVVTNRFITNNRGIYTTMMGGSMVQFNYPCELVPVEDVIGSVLVESFAHGERCICHDTTDGRNYGVSIYVSKSLCDGYSLVKLSSTYSGDTYADVKDISLSKVK